MLIEPDTAVLHTIQSLFRHVSAYLGVKERDPKAHRLLGLIFEKEGDVNKAVGCYKVCMPVFVGWGGSVYSKNQRLFTHNFEILAPLIAKSTVSLELLSEVEI